MDFAMEYEIFMSRVYQCGRDFKNGADADHFRPLERNIRILELQKEAIQKGQPPIRTKSVKELESDVDQEAWKIKNYVRGAIREAESKYDYRLNVEQKKVFAESAKILSDPTYENIIAAIEKTDRVLRDIDLLPQ